VSLLGGGNQSAGFGRTSILYGAIVAVVTLISFATVRERVFHRDPEKAGLRKTWGGGAEPAVHDPDRGALHAHDRHEHHGGGGELLFQVPTSGPKS
jgi:hypothetical protein